MASLPVRSKYDLSRIGLCKTDYVELRLDYLKKLEDLEMESLSQHRDMLILTVRDPSEGGVYPVDTEKKKQFLENAIRLGFLVDIEAAFSEEYDVDCTGQIVSSHYLEEAPDYEVLKQFAEKYRDISKFTKIALKSGNDSFSKLVELLALYKNMAVMETDGDGSTRILYSLLGSKLIYCHSGEKTSPGQLSCDDAIRVLRIIEKKGGL